MKDFENEDEFMKEMRELDFLEELRLKEIMREAFAESVNWQFELLKEVGSECWLSMPFDTERKRNVLKSMREYYESQEEYERCSLLKQTEDLLISC